MYAIIKYLTWISWNLYSVTTFKLNFTIVIHVINKNQYGSPEQTHSIFLGTVMYKLNSSIMHRLNYRGFYCLLLQSYLPCVSMHSAQRLH